MRILPGSQLLIFFFSLLIFSISITQYDGLRTYGAGFMPTILSAILMFFSIVDGFVSVNRKSNKIKFNKDEFVSLGLVISSIGFFILFMGYLGFFICSSIFLFCLMSWRNTNKKWLNLIYSLLTSAAIYYVFGTILMVALPSGIWI